MSKSCVSSLRYSRFAAVAAYDSANETLVRNGVPLIYCQRLFADGTAAWKDKGERK